MITKHIENKPFFTIILPNHNGAPHIRKCLDSLVSQTFTNFEVVVIDGKSTDGSHQIIDDCVKNDPRIRRISNPKDTGLSDAVNIGIATAKGEYGLWLGSDDKLIDDEVLADANKFLINKPSVLAWGSYKIYWSKAGVHQPMKKRQFDINLLWLTDTIMCGNVFFNISYVCNKSLKLNTDLKYSMDYDLWLKILQTKPTSTLLNCIPNRYIHEFRMSESNITGNNIYAGTFEARKVALKYAPTVIHKIFINIFIMIQILYQKVREIIISEMSKRKWMFFKI